MTVQLLKYFRICILSHKHRTTRALSAMSSTKNKGADGRKSVVSLDILILSLITHLELLVAIPIYAYIIFLFKFFPPAEDMQASSFSPFLFHILIFL